MTEIWTAVAVFIGLLAAALGSLALSRKLPPRYVADETITVVRLAMNIFVVTTSLVLGLLLNSSKNTFESIDRNVHSFATDLVLLDRSLRHLGPEAAPTRARLAAYVAQAIAGTWRKEGEPVLDDRVAERMLDEVGDALGALRPTDPLRFDLWRDAQASYQNVVRRRWSLIEESEGTIPAAFLLSLTGWLALIFASFGYRAPANAVVISTLSVAALLIAAAIYLILDMDVAFSGPIQISPAPMQRTLEQLRR